MKILFIAPYLPSSIRPRPYNFIKGLHDQGHAVYFVGLTDEYAALGKSSDLAAYCTKIELFHPSRIRSFSNCAAALFRNQALQTAYAYSRKLKARVKEILTDNKFDIIHIEHIRAGQYLPATRDIPAVFDSVDCITDLYRQFSAAVKPGLRRNLTLIEYQKLKKYEPAVLSRFDSILVTTERDKAALEKLALTCARNIPDIKVLQIGIDQEYFNSHVGKPDPYTIVFSGKMGYYANELAAVHFIRDIFPIISTSVNTAKFYVVGANPSKRLQSMADGKNIFVTGWVPDIRKFLARAQVVVCPVQVSVGIQNKLLEAMAMSKAIVTYPEVTRPLLNSQSGNLFLTAGTPEDFAEKIINILNNNALRKSLEANALTYVKKYYRWEQRVSELVDCYNQAAK